MKQIWIIHGGDSFSTHEAYINSLQSSSIDYERLKPAQRWSTWLSGQFDHADVLTPRFPNSQNAQFAEWKLYFEKLLPFFSHDVSLIGHSLGAMFLAKYLHEEPLQTPVNQLILLAGGYDDDQNEDYGSFKINSAKGLEKSAHSIHLLHSKDDPVVPYKELLKFENDLPSAHVHRFSDKNHFLNETFPELVSIIKNNL